MSFVNGFKRLKSAPPLLFSSGGGAMCFCLLDMYNCEDRVSYTFIPAVNSVLYSVMLNLPEHLISLESSFPTGQILKQVQDDDYIYPRNDYRLVVITDRLNTFTPDDKLVAITDQPKRIYPYTRSEVAA